MFSGFRDLALKPDCLGNFQLAVDCSAHLHVTQSPNHPITVTPSPIIQHTLPCQTAVFKAVRNHFVRVASRRLSQMRNPAGIDAFSTSDAGGSKRLQIADR
jgi:hypothetical protein